MCVQSLINASDLISKRKTPIDGQLFLIKHLLILREQIAPFSVDFAVKEMVLDFSKLKEAAMKFLSKKSKLLSINRDNAFLEFLLQGTLQVKESFIDSKREVDKQLKLTCEQYINEISNNLSGSIRQYLQKSHVILKINRDQNNPNKVSLRQQPFAKPEVVHDLLVENYNKMKKTLPEIFQTLSIYLANKDTEQILFKPIKVSIDFSLVHTCRPIKCIRFESLFDKTTESNIVESKHIESILLLLILILTLDQCATSLPRNFSSYSRPVFRRGPSDHRLSKSRTSTLHLFVESRTRMCISFFKTFVDQSPDIQLIVEKRFNSMNSRFLFKNSI